MQNLYDYKKHAILYVDDEEKSLKYFNRAFGDSFRILTASNARDGYEQLVQHQDDIGLILTDQRMPDETGVQLLERARKLRPRIIRILVTAYSDLQAAIDAVNTGAIYKYITKPWDVPQLEITLKRGIEFFMVQRERDSLLREKLSALHKMVITDRVISLGVLAAGLGHHMRNAMVAVRTFIDLAPEMLHREQPDIEELRHPEFWNSFYKKVQTKVKSIIDLLNGLDEATDKTDPLFGDSIRLRKMVSDVYSELKPEFERQMIKVSNDIPDDLPELTVDAKKLFKLFELLLRDELINLPEGSHVQLNAQIVENPSGGREVEIQVADNGPGLPEDTIRSLFDPFFVRSDQPQEFGIYLMACYFIVYHHGGRIDIRNREEKGLQFNLYLPLEPRPLQAENDAQEFLTKVMNNESLWERLLSSA